MKHFRITVAFAAALLACAAPAWADEAVFSRVTKSGTLRCGYALSYPSLEKDANTGEIRGISREVTEAVADRLGLKVEWTQEAGFGTAETAIAANKFDLVCSDVCIQPDRLKAAWFSKPYLIEPIYAFARDDDHRFDADRSLANAENISISSIDGSILERYARDWFPKARRLDAGEYAAAGDSMMAVAAGKADLSFHNAFTIDRFNSGQSKKVRIVGAPVGLCRGAFLLPPGEIRFKMMIDAAMEELISIGRVDEIISRHFPKNDKYWRSP